MIFSYRKTFAKKLLIVFLLSLLIAQSASAFNPFSIIPIPITTDPLPPVPVGDSGLRTKEVGFTIMGITVPGVTLDSLMIFGLRKIIDKLSDDTVKWINGGFDGSPAFATNPEAFFFDVINDVGGEFIVGIGAGALCSPFQAQIKLSLKTTIQRLQTGSRSQYGGTCTFTSAVGNIQQFVNGDFAQGGWDGWFLLTQGKNNNQYTGLVDTAAELSIRIAGETSIEQSRLDWANGFLSWSECLDPKGASASQCKKRGPTRTPGSVIESQLEKSLNAEFDQLNLADEFDEILSALAGRLLGEVFNSGKGLIDPSKSSGPGWAGGGGGGNVGASGSCFADKSTAIVNVDTITWDVTVIGGNSPTYSWSGTDGLTGSTQSVQKLYTIPGQKTAGVQVNDTIMVNGIPQPRSFTITCRNKVDVLKWPPIVAQCAPYDAAGNKVFVYKPYLNLIWRASNVSGGSGVYTSYVWTGTNDTVKSGDGSGNFVTLPRPLKVLPRVTTGNAFPRWYDIGGQQSVDLMIVDADATQPPGKATCDKVDILPYAN